jgi:anti-sigma regulatory factor (Ser/Thr protein kinase)
VDQGSVRRARLGRPLAEESAATRGERDEDVGVPIGGGPTEPQGDAIIGAAMEGLRRAAHEVEEERTLAATLQRSLLRERFPYMPGLRVAARYLPGSNEAEVGGDWYDLIPLRDGRVGLVIGDVVGRGIAAAARMAHLQSAVRAYALEGLRPSVVLERTNAFALELERPGMATLLYAVLDAEAGTLRFASAGHPPPLIVASTGEARFAEGSPGNPIGAVGFAAYEEAATTVEAGSVVLLYTDGLIERPDVGLTEGLEALRVAVAGLPAEPDSLCRALPDSVLPRAPTDDTAILGVKLEALGGVPLAVTLPAESESLAPVRRVLARWMREAGADDVEIYETLVAVGEACANAIAHAYPALEASFEVAGVVSESDVEIAVRDYGHWRPPRGEVRHRGLRLMEELMDSVVVDKGDSGTTVTLKRRLQKGVQA